MLARVLCLFAAGWLGVGASVSLHAAAPPAGGVRLDRNGDRLPEGAVARLGTTRFRAASPDRAQLSPDGKALVVVGSSSRMLVLDVATGIPLPGPEPAGGAADESVGEADAVLTERALLVWRTLERTLTVVSPRTGRLVSKIDTRDLAVERVVAAPGGNRIAVIGRRSADHPAFRVEVVDLTRGAGPRSFAGWPAVGVGGNFSTDGKRLAVWETDVSYPDTGQTVRVWDVETGKVARALVLIEGFQTAALAPDGKELALAFESGRVERWDVASGKRTHDFRGRFGASERLTYSPDGKWLFAAGPHDVQGWGLRTGRRLSLPVGPKCRFCSLVVTPGGRAIACGARGSSLLVWDAFSGRAVSATPGHRAPVAALTFSSDGRRVRSVDLDGSRIDWDQTGKVLRTLAADELDEDVEGLQESGASAPIARYGFAPGGRYLGTVVGRGLQAEVRESDSSEALFSCDLTPGAGLPAFSGNGALVALAAKGEGRAASIWKTATGEKCLDVAVPGDVRGLAFSPDGDRLAALAMVGKKHFELSMWRADTGKPLAGFRPLKGLPRGPDGLLVFCPTGGALAIVDEANAVRIVQAHTGRLLRSLEECDQGIVALAFSPDGRCLAIAASGPDSSGGSVALWELSTGKKRWGLPLEGQQPTALAFSPDGELLATGHADGSILLWALRGGKIARAPVWADLTGASAPRAYRAMRALASSPPEAVALCRKHLRPVTTKPLPPDVIERLLFHLESEDFEVREWAAARLEREGEAIEGALEKALALAPDLETRLRLERLLRRCRAGVVPPELIGPLRAVEVLEWVGTKQAREVLADLAKGEPGSLQSREARGALQRLARRAAF